VTKDQDRRSRNLSNRIYRRFTRRGWKVGSIVFVAVGILLFALSNGAITAGDAPALEAGVPADLRIFVEALGGIIVIFGVFSGLAHFVAKPAAREIVAEHRRDPDAHGQLAIVTRLETQFTEITTLQGKVIRKLAVMDERVMNGFANLPCKDRGVVACVEFNDDRNEDGV
jgi:hypothetical protein